MIAVGVIAGATVGAVAVLIILGVLVVVGMVFLTKRRSQKVKLLGYNVSLSLRYCVLYSEEVCTKLLDLIYRKSERAYTAQPGKSKVFISWTSTSKVV